MALMPGLRLSPPRGAPFVARLGRFDVAGILGRGGMGFVLDAYDPELQRPVALKIMKPELGRDTLAADRFLQEARSAARLQHPNVVSIYEVSTNTDPRFIVMELVRGKSLASIIDCESPLRPVRAARITLEILAALAHAHAEGIIHRDVKPGNILLDARVQTAKLTDFGLARGVDDALRHTAAGCVVGTPWYIAPEQATGQYRLDGRCDLFSTGVVLFEMLTGALPFPGRDPREVMQRICHEPHLILAHTRTVPPGPAGPGSQQVPADKSPGSLSDGRGVCPGLAHLSGAAPDRRGGIDRTVARAHNV